MTDLIFMVCLLPAVGRADHSDETVSAFIHEALFTTVTCVQVSTVCAPDGTTSKAGG